MNRSADRKRRLASKGPLKRELMAAKQLLKLLMPHIILQPPDDDQISNFSPVTETFSPQSVDAVKWLEKIVEQ